MTQEDWDREVARARRWSELEDDPGGILAAGLTVLVQKFPVPNTDGLPPEEAEAVLARWRAEVHAYMDARALNGPPLIPSADPVRDRV